MKLVKEALDNTMKKIFTKQGVIFAEIMSAWQHIVDEELSNKCWPYKIVSYTEKRQQVNALYVCSDDTLTSLAITYKQCLIVERAALYFGRKVIDKVNVKINITA